ncbi:hypothetical protein Hanom_Chr03g00197341 [Helianthus anomalus]
MAVSVRSGNGRPADRSGNGRPADRSGNEERERQKEREEHKGVGRRTDVGLAAAVGGFRRWCSSDRACDTRTCFSMFKHIGFDLLILFMGISNKLGLSCYF